MCQIVRNVPSRNVKESFEKFLDPGTNADDFHNLTSSFLFIDHL